MSIGKFFKSIGQERIRVSLRRKQNRPEQRNVKRTERLKKETQVQARRSSEEVVTGEDVQHVVCGVDVCEEEPLYSQATNQVAGLALVVWGCFPAPPPHHLTYLMLYRTLPSWKIRSSLLSVVTSWKLAPFSLAKNKSGFQMESNMEGSRSRELSGYSL